MDIPQTERRQQQTIGQWLRFTAPLALTALLRALSLDGSAGVSRLASFAPMLAANAGVTISAARQLRAHPPPPGDTSLKRQIAALAATLLLWNLTFWLLAAAADGAPYMQRLCPLFVLVALQAVCAVYDAPSGCTAFLLFALFYAGPVVTQVWLIAAKLDGGGEGGGRGWGTVLSPLLVYESIALLGVCSSLLRRRDVTVRKLCVACLLLGLLVFQGMLAGGVGAGARSRSLVLVLPLLLLAWALPFAAWARLALRSALRSVRRCWQGVGARVRQRHQERAALAEQQAVAGGDDGAAVDGAEVAPAAAAGDTSAAGAVEFDVSAIPKAGALPPPVDELCASAEKEASASALADQLRRLQELLAAHPTWTAPAVQQRVILVGTRRLEQGRAWDEAAQKRVGEILRALHPIGQINRRFAQQLQRFSSRRRSSSGDAVMLVSTSGAGVV